jgi:ACS family tartrate transporter-like MFS transporter
MVNSIGQLGGFGGPYLVGWVRETSNSFAFGMVALGGCLLLSALILFVLAAPERLASASKVGAAAVAGGEPIP